MYSVAVADSFLSYHISRSKPPLRLVLRRRKRSILRLMHGLNAPPAAVAVAVVTGLLGVAVAMGGQPGSALRLNNLMSTSPTRWRSLRSLERNLNYT